jgi:hypothetical protein
MPRPLSRGGTPPFATALPHSPLVMPTFMPGWVSSSCRSRCRPYRARVVVCPVSRFFGPPCRAPLLRSAAVAEPPACACPHACEIPSTIAQPCTPARMRTPSGRPRPSLLLRCLARGTSPTRLQHRHGLCHAGCRVHARAWERGEALRAFRVPSPPTRPRTPVRHCWPRASCFFPPP